MTSPAKFIRGLCEKVFVLATVGIMAVCAESLPDSAMGVGLFDKLPQTLVAVQAESIDLIVHEATVITGMRVMAGFAFSFFKQDMGIRTGQAFLQFFVARIAEPRFFLFYSGRGLRNRRQK